MWPVPQSYQCYKYSYISQILCLIICFYTSYHELYLKFNGSNMYSKVIVNERGNKFGCIHLTAGQNNQDVEKLTKIFRFKMSY